LLRSPFCIATHQTDVRERRAHHSAPNHHLTLAIPALPRRSLRSGVRRQQIQQRRLHFSQTLDLNIHRWLGLFVHRLCPLAPTTQLRCDLQTSRCSWLPDKKVGCRDPERGLGGWGFEATEPNQASKARLADVVPRRHCTFSGLHLYKGMERKARPSPLR